MENQMAPGRKGPFTDDIEIPLNSDNWGAQIVLEQGGKYQEWARRGCVFAARTAAAAVIPINSTLTNAPALWNPSSSGKVLIPIKIMLSGATAGTAMLSGLTISGIGSAGDSIGTGAPVVTWTNVAPSSTQVGSGKTSTTKFAPAVSTYTVNPPVIMDLGIGWNMVTAAGENTMTMVYDFEGVLLVPPGGVINLGSATAATVGTFWTTILFAELHLAPGGLS